jgi:hypothetical protein
MDSLVRAALRGTSRIAAKYNMPESHGSAGADPRQTSAKQSCDDTSVNLEYSIYYFGVPALVQHKWQKE